MKNIQIMCQLIALVMIEVIMVTKKLCGWEMPWLWVFSPIWIEVLIGLISGIMAGCIEAFMKDSKEG